MSREWCIISDIDDTLFRTSTECLPMLSAFINTFLKHPKSIDGMPELYRLIQLELSRTRFWYISTSPYNIFPYFRSRLSLAQYPNGNMVIPSWKEALLIHSLGLVYIYKIACIEKLHRYYSSRKVVCFGDSLMKDPEVYGEIYRRYPDWVFIILIRMVGSESLYRNSRPRFQKAFTGVPTNMYYIFQKPANIGEVLLLGITS
jgi:phosphatidate phosphatase APP1